MFSSSFSKIIFLSALLINTASAIASPKDNVVLGMQYFDKGNYIGALEHFKKAEAAGLTTAQLTYNFASAYYKLAQYQLSKEHFIELINNNELAFEASYSLGLIEHKLGRNKQAIRWFEKSEDSTSNAKLKALARKQINSIVSLDDKPWFGFVSTSLGYDTNIAYAPSSIASNRSGTLLKVIGYADWDLSKSITKGFHLGAIYFSNNYINSNEFDDDSLAIFAELHKPVDKWDITYGFGLGESTYAHANYLDTTSIYSKARTTVSKGKEFRIELKRDEISSRSNQFLYLEGSRTALKVDYRLTKKSREYRLNTGLEFNQRNNTVAASFSPTRFEVGTRIIKKISNGYKVAAELGIRLSEYKTVATQNRSDKRLRIKLEGTHKINAVWTGKTEFIYINNRSSEAGSQYSKSMILASIYSVF